MKRKKSSVFKGFLTAILLVSAFGQVSKTANVSPNLRIKPIYTSSKNELQPAASFSEGITVGGEHSPLVVEAGKNLILECILEHAAIGTKDYIKIDWYERGSNEMVKHDFSDEDRIFTQEIFNHNEGKFVRTLSFMPVTKHDDGTFVCEAEFGDSNILRKEILIRVIDVQWKMKGIVGQPLGQSLTIDCAANGIAHPSYIKILDESGQEIKTNGSYYVAGSDVTVKNLTKKEQGAKIVCLAVLVDESDEKTIVATLRNILTIDAWYPPKFLTSSVKKNSLEGQNITVTCTVIDSNPPVNKIEITKDGRVVASNERHLIQQRGPNTKLLKVIGIEGDDFGTYECVAHNAKLQSKHLVILAKAKPPRQPKVSLYDSSLHSVTWKISDDDADLEQGYLPVYSYQISYQIYGPIMNEPNSSNDLGAIYTEVAKTNTVRKSSSNYYVIDGLEPGANYEFQFVAISKVGHSDPITEKVRPGKRINALKSSSPSNNTVMKLVLVTFAILSIFAHDITNIATVSF